MRFPIDVAFLTWPAPDDGVRVLGVHDSLRPLRVAGVPRRERTAPRSRIAALELAAGQAAKLGLRAGADLREA